MFDCGSFALLKTCSVQFMVNLQIFDYLATQGWRQTKFSV